jgi:RimJ/RimL family protein N-acetyltransferase
MSVAMLDVPVTEDVFISGIYSSDEETYLKIFETDTVSKTLLAVPFPYSLDDAKWWVNHTSQQCADKGCRWQFSIRKRSIGNIVIGGIGINEVEEETGFAEIGYWLDAPYWGQGLMPIILTAWIQYIKQQQSLNPSHYANIIAMNADIFSENIKSSRVLQKSGFQFVCDMPKKYVKNGVEIDATRYIFYLN